MTHAEAQAKDPEEIIEFLTKGGKIIEASLPFITTLFEKIGEALKNIGGPNSPAGRLKRIQALEAQNLAQKELNKLYNQKLGLL